MKSFDESSGFLSFFINSLHFNQQSCPEIFMLVKGPYIKDVRTEGGGGVGPKADIVREVAWIYSYRSSQNADKGGGVPKSRKLCGRPL